MFVGVTCQEAASTSDQPPANKQSEAAPLLNSVVIEKGADEPQRRAPVSCWTRTLLAVAFLLFNMTLTLTVLSVIHERVPQQPTLPDVAFDVLPRHEQALDAAEYLLMAMTSGVAVLLFVHRHRLVILRRLCVVAGLLYLLRALCMATTSLPTANKHYFCAPKANVSSTGAFLVVVIKRVASLSLGMGLSVNGRHHFCGDFIFSGHTVVLVLAYLFQREYLLPTRVRTLGWRALHALLFGASSVGVACLLISRAHYSIDVLLAYVLTTRLFYAYHTLCYTPALHQRGAHNLWARVWWWPLFATFEPCDGQAKPCACCGRAQRLPRAFEWPLPWPRLLRQRLVKRRAQRLLLPAGGC